MGWRRPWRFPAMAGGLVAMIVLASCSNGAPQPQASPTPQDLESAAIARGLVRDVKGGDISGLYARDTDRLCLVRDGGSYRIGAFVDYGDKLSCTGQGRASHAGATLAVEFTGRGGVKCAFSARYDGERINFPAQLPDSCAAFCSSRASFGALSVERMSESAAEARALRSAEGTRLCRD